MLWKKIYNKKILFNDLILRKPEIFINFSIKNFLESQKIHSHSISLISKKKLNLIMDDFLMSNSFFNIFSNQLKIKYDKNLNNNNIFILKMENDHFENFLDFFLNIFIIKAKKKNIYFLMKMNKNGQIFLNFKTISDFEADDFFFFDLYNFKFSININYSFFKNKNLNEIYFLYVKKLFF